jgi:methionyl-tRNA formyltransferase|tara:strand:- start:9193 stop:10116 length:924 start_codon:yes stop_codon:yes gene_type:complete
MNIIFAGSPAPSAKILKRLHLDGINISLVISQPDKRSKRGSSTDPSEVSIVAQELNLRTIKPLDLNDPDFKSLVQSLDVDFVVVSAYGKIIPQWLLEHPNKLPINIHFSLLPKYRGASPIQSVLISGEFETGISFMKMNERMDEGDIIKTLPMEIHTKDNKDELEDRLSDLAANNINAILKDVLADNFRLETQDQVLATYCSKIKKVDGEINFKESSEVILRKFNAYKGWPGSYFLHKEIMVKVHAMHIDNSNYDAEPGSILNFDKLGILVKTYNSAIVITYLQFPNKKSISTSDAINSYLSFFTRL